MQKLVIGFWFLIAGMAILYVLLRLALGIVVIALGIILLIIVGYLAFRFYRALK